MHGRVDVQVGTLSKALGALGGYVAGSRSLIEFLYQRARPFLFSTSHPPSVAATCLAALDVLETEPRWMEQLWENTRFFKAGLEALGFNTGQSESPITPVIVGESSLCGQVVRSALRGRRVCPGHHVSHGCARQGPGPDDCDGFAHPAGASVRAGCVQESRGRARNYLKGKTRGRSKIPRYR